MIKALTWKWESKKLPLLILACYLLPLLAYVGYAANIVPPHLSWTITSLGLVLLCFGTSLLFVLLRSLENTISLNPLAIVPEPIQEKAAAPAFNVEDPQLSEKLNSSLEELQKLSLEKDQACRSFNALEADYEKERSLFQTRSKEQESSIENLQGTIAQQNTLLEQRQNQIIKLQNENADLKYEVRMLLQLGETDPQEAPQAKVGNQEAQPSLPNEKSQEASANSEVSLQLKKCLELAENLEGSSRLGAEASNVGEIPIEMQTLDLRRLTDIFRSEVNQPLLLYSPSRGKLLFASDQVSELLGWSKEKTMSDFFFLIQKGKAEWEQAVMSLNQEQESHARLVLRTKGGQDLMLYCQMGLIRTGIFTNQVMVLLYHPV